MKHRHGSVANQSAGVLISGISIVIISVVIDLETGFQAFFIMVVTGIYAVLMQNIAFTGDYTMRLCF